MLNLNFHHLYYFYRIAEAGTMSQAAKELRLSQPALSYQIKYLQNALGVKLFQKSGHKLSLTEEGKIALTYARRIFDMGKEFMDNLHDRSLQNRIRIQIGVSNAVPKSVANKLLLALLKIAPTISVQVEEDKLERMAEALNDHRLDLVLSDTPFQSPLYEGIRNQLVGKVPIRFCVESSLARKYQKMPASLNHAPFILPTSDSRIYHALKEYFVEHKINPNIVAEIHDIELVRLVAQEKIGIAPLSSLSKNLIYLPNYKLHIFETTYLIVKERAHPHPVTSQLLHSFRLK